MFPGRQRLGGNAAGIKEKEEVGEKEEKRLSKIVLGELFIHQKYGFHFGTNPSGLESLANMPYTYTYTVTLSSFFQ